MAEEEKKERRVDRALRTFAEQLIQRMEDASRDLSWTKGWTGDKVRFFGLPQNIKGNTYLGGNALMLTLHTAENGYSMPVYMTPKQARELGAHVLKGEKATDVVKGGIVVTDKDGNRIPEEVYDNLSDEEKKNYNKRPYIRNFCEFNIDQTNFKEVHPKRYAALLSKFQNGVDQDRQDTRGMYQNEALDRVLHEEGAWICPIIERPGSEAYYSPSTNDIHLPAKENFNIHPGNAEETFKDGQEFYSTALHEMAHSTGHESQLNREGITSGKAHFGNDEYAKEELVAELTAAMVSNALGFDKRITENSAAYLKGWAAKLRESPKYITSVLSAVNKATRMEIEHIDAQRKVLGQKPLMEGNLDGVEENKSNEEQKTQTATELEAGDKESELLSLLGLSDQPTYYNNVVLSHEGPDGEYHDSVDKFALYNLFNNGENDKIMDTMRRAKEDLGLTIDNTLLSSFKAELPSYERIGEDNEHVYLLSPDDEENFMLMEKVSRDDLLHKHIPTHLDSEMLALEGYDKDKIERIMSLADELGLEKKPEKVTSSVENTEAAKQEENEQETDALLHDDKDEKKKYYFFFAFIPPAGAKDLAEMRQKGDQEGFLSYVQKEYLQEPQPLVQSQVYKTPDTGEKSIELLAENEDFAISRHVDTDVYLLIRKVDGEYIFKDIELDGLSCDASKVVMDVAKADAENRFASLGERPSFTMPNGEVLELRYNKETDQIEAGNVLADDTFKLRSAFSYNHDISATQNVEHVHGLLEGLPMYQNEESEAVGTGQMTKQREEIAKEFDGMDRRFVMPGGQNMEYDYLKDKNVILVIDSSTRDSYIFDYDITRPISENMSNIKDELSQEPRYRTQETENQEIGETQQASQSEKPVEVQDEKAEKKFYSSFAFLQTQEDTNEFEKLRDEGRYDEMLLLAAEHVQDSDIDLAYVKENASSYHGDDLVTENEEIAIVYNGEVGGTYDLLMKVSENDIREQIEREGGLEYNHKPDYPKAVWDIQRTMVKEEWKNAPDDSTIKMESGDVLKVTFNPDKDRMEIIDPAQGEEPIQTVLYDYTKGVKENFGYAYEEMGNWPEYQAREMETIAPETERSDMEGKLYYEVFNEDRDMEDVISHKFESFHRKADEIGMLSLANEIDKGFPLEQKHVNLRPLEKDETLPETILASDGDHTVTYSEDMDLYFVYRKVDKEDIVRDIEENGISSDATREVLDVARENELKNHPTGLKPYVESMKDKSDVLSGDLTLLPKYSVAHRAFEDSLYLTDELDKVKNSPNEYDRMYKITLQKDIIKNSELLKSELKKGVDTYKKTIAPAHEDSNIETNVVADAKHIAATGIPMEKAEKIAKEKADDKTHEQMHEELDFQQERKEKEEQEEKAEKEKKQQEEKKERPKMTDIHAAILLTALQQAEKEDGVWMNKGYRQNAFFMFGDKRIEAYNNVMMNLNAEQKGFRTNSYAHYNTAKANGIFVMESQKALPFSWTNWQYVNQSDESVKLTSAQYKELSKEDKILYSVRADRRQEAIFNVDQTVFPATGGEEYINFLKEYGDKMEEIKVDNNTNIYSNYAQSVIRHPNAIVLMLDGDNYKSYKSSARKINEILGLPLGKAEYNGKPVDYVEFSRYKLDSYLSKLNASKSKISICTPDANPILVKDVINPNKVLEKANSTARAFAKTDGMNFERVMVVRDAGYDAATNTFTVSGMSSPGKDSRENAIQKAADIFRKMSAVTGQTDRLDRYGRNNLTPIDDMKYDRLVQELASGVMMSRMGLPARIADENRELIPYWQMEIAENPKMMGIIERDVNQSIEVIDKLVMGEKPNYKEMKGILPQKEVRFKRDYYVIKELNKYPSMENKEFVLVRDKASQSASVILPKGASLEVDNEVQGMRKDRIATVLRKQGIENVTFYNAGGSLGLKQNNDFFRDKEVSVVKLKQYEFVKQDSIDVKPMLAKVATPRIQDFRMLRKDDGKYFFYIKPVGEKSFCIEPEKKYTNSFFAALKTKDPREISNMKNTLSERFYKLGTEYQDVKRDFITPRKIDVDYSRIEWANITKSKNAEQGNVVIAKIDGVIHHASITKEQYDRLFLANDMNAYKVNTAALTFEKELRKDVAREQTLGFKESEDVSQSEGKGQSQSQESPHESASIPEGKGESEDIKPSIEPQRMAGGMHV